MIDDVTKKVSTIDDLVEIRYLTDEEIEVKRTEGGFISLRLSENEFYPRISVYRIFPLSKPNEFISLREIGTNRDLGKEIGIIRDLQNISKEKVEILHDEIDRRYFTPQIKHVFSLKDEFGYVYMDIESSAGIKKITVQNGSSNFIKITEERIIIIDIDGNRYEITDYPSLDSKSIRLLETMV